jgi:hypothetical protein
MWNLMQRISDTLYHEHVADDVLKPVAHDVPPQLYEVCRAELTQDRGQP